MHRNCEKGDGGGNEKWMHKCAEYNERVYCQF